MKNLMKKSKKGFTLMEMLIVVAIIAILVVIAIPTFTNALNDAKKQTDVANARAWYSELVVCAMLNEGKLPADNDPSYPNKPAAKADGGDFVISGDGTAAGIIVTYKQGDKEIETFPKN